MVTVLALTLVCALAAPMVTSGGASADVWSQAPFPADFRSESTQTLPSDLDAWARSVADVDHPGPIVGMQGCGAVTVLDDGPTEFSLFDGEALPARWTSAELCRFDGNALILDLDGETTTADGSAVVGAAHARFVRGGETSPFVRAAIDLSDGRCFSIAPSDGLLAGPGAGRYLLQGWNFGGDSAVDCQARQVAATTTSTTTSTTTTAATSTSTSTTLSTAATTTVASATIASTPAGASGVEPVAAFPVAGTATYTG